MTLFSRGDRTFNLELSREGTAVIERLHLGDAGPQRIEYASEHAALVAYKQRCLGVVDEGWHVMLGDEDLARPVACDPAIEAAISIDDAEQLAVYADWLIERGDPCGELASLRGRNDPALADAIAALENARSDELFGLFAAMPNHGQVRYRWRNGWVESIEVANITQPPPYRHHPDSPLGTLIAIALIAPAA